MKNVLVTRTINQAQELVQTLENQGITTFVEPLFSVEKIEVKTQFTQEISAIIITSSNAASGIISLNLPKTIKIFAVGKKTAQKLSELGFSNIIFPQENSAAALLKLITENHKDKTGLILYLHGSIITLDFEKELKDSGFNVKKLLTYKTHEIANFSPQLLKFLQQNNFDHILFFSQNGVKIFFNLAKKHNMLEYFTRTRLVCLSQRILTETQKFNFKNSATFDQFPILKNFYD
jgi:uroporphyrinogen-III synthase